jgi:hypothetical protein
MYVLSFIRYNIWMLLTYDHQKLLFLDQSNAKSGQFFFYSKDGKYMIKTMTSAESKFLRRSEREMLSLFCIWYLHGFISHPLLLLHTYFQSLHTTSVTAP